MTTDPVGGAEALRPGTIVSFRFPLGEGEGRVKTRPCLVIARSLGKDGAPRVTIAYGTSAGTQSNRGLDLELSEPETYKAAGLRRPTRFVLMRRVTVRLSDPSLDRRKAGSPVIGVLPPSSMGALEQLTRSLGATITEDRRRGSVGRRPPERSTRTICWQRRRAGRPLPVVVEYRWRKCVSGQPSSESSGSPGSVLESASGCQRAG